MKVSVLALFLAAAVLLGGCAVNAERLDSVGAEVKKMIGSSPDVEFESPGPIEGNA